MACTIGRGTSVDGCTGIRLMKAINVEMKIELTLGAIHYLDDTTLNSGGGGGSSAYSAGALFLSDGLRFFGRLSWE